MAHADGKMKERADSRPMAEDALIYLLSGSSKTGLINP